MHTEQQLSSIAQQIVDLRKFQKETGVGTFRSQGTLIQHLTAQETVVVAQLVNAALGVK